MVDNGITDNLINPTFHPLNSMQGGQAFLDLDEHVLKDVFGCFLGFDMTLDKTKKLVVVVLPDGRKLLVIS